MELLGIGIALGALFCALLATCAAALDWLAGRHERRHSPPEWVGNRWRGIAPPRAGEENGQLEDE
jgi:hypothetical protein